MKLIESSYPTRGQVEPWNPSKTVPQHILPGNPNCPSTSFQHILVHKSTRSLLTTRRLESLEPQVKPFPHPTQTCPAKPQKFLIILITIFQPAPLVEASNLTRDQSNILNPRDQARFLKIRQKPPTPPEARTDSWLLENLWWDQRAHTSPEIQPSIWAANPCQNRGYPNHQKSSLQVCWWPSTQPQATLARSERKQKPRTETNKQTNTHPTKTNTEIGT